MAKTKLLLQSALLTVCVSILCAAPQTFEIRALSARPDMVSGGDVLVRVAAPSDAALKKVRLALNGADVTSAFRPARDQHAVVGLVTGLKQGRNILELTRDGSRKASLELTNYAITGPIISGPHQTPFICQTEAWGLGAALDADCSAKTRVEYLYWSASAGKFNPFDPAGPRPPDLQQTTTTEGHQVDYIVRKETGTINRAVYEIAFLHQPGTPLPDPWTSSPGWNGRLVYTFGGGARRAIARPPPRAAFYSTARSPKATRWRRPR
ncbi:MAG: DUF6351 family protein [Acidobacteriia bacterium]|nr:DUF6351 family protein [Terriglobia bacterium]